MTASLTNPNIVELARDIATAYRNGQAVRALLLLVWLSLSILLFLKGSAVVLLVLLLLAVLGIEFIYYSQNGLERRVVSTLDALLEGEVERRIEEAFNRNNRRELEENLRRQLYELYVEDFYRRNPNSSPGELADYLRTLDLTFRCLDVVCDSLEPEVEEIRKNLLSLAEKLIPIVAVAASGMPGVELLKRKRAFLAELRARFSEDVVRERLLGQAAELCRELSDEIIEKVAREVQGGAEVTAP